MSNEETLQRWAAFIDKIRVRLEEVLAEGDAGFREMIAADPTDAQSFGNAMSGMRFRVEPLIVGPAHTSTSGAPGSAFSYTLWSGMPAPPFSTAAASCWASARSRSTTRPVLAARWPATSSSPSICSSPCWPISSRALSA